MHERTRQFQQTHIELAECVLKNNIFEHNTCFYKQLFTLHLIRICSENSFYNRRCNDLEVWLRERGYSDKLVRRQIFKACKRKRKDLLNDMKD